MLRSLISISILLIVSSCSTIDYNTPSHRMIIPETTSKDPLKGGSFGLSYGGTHEIELITSGDFIFNSDTYTNIDKRINNHVTTSSHLNISLWDDFDFLYTSVYDGPTLFGVNYQILGGDKTINGWKVSLALMGGITNIEEASIRTANGLNQFDGEVQLKTISSTLALGRRLSEKVIIYTNLFFDKIEHDAKAKVNGQTRETIKGTVHNYGASFGARANFGPIFFNGELSHRAVDWKKFKTKELSTLSGSIGLQW